MLYADLVEVLSKRGNHVFWHAVATHRTCDFEADLEASLPEGVGLTWVDCKRLPVDSYGDLDSSRLGWAEGDIVCLLDVDFLLTVRNGASLLRQLRPPAMGVLDRGGKLLVLAQRPQGEFPVLDGSSVVHDGLPAHLSALPDEALETYPPFEALSPRQRRDVLSSAKGFRGVISRLGRQITSSAEGAAVCPPRPAREQILEEVASEALVELGDTAVGGVLAATDTVGRRIHCDDVDDVVFTRLRSAGLARVDPATDEVLLFPGVSDTQSRRIVALADMKSLTSPVWNQVSQNVFVIERCVRQLVGRRLAEGPPEEQEEFLATYAPTIERNWQQEWGHANAANPAGPVTPLGYVNLTDLLAVAMDLSSTRHVGGLSSAQWRQLADDIVPVRNRVGHMRLPSSYDITVTAKWRRSLQRSLDTAT